MKRKDFIKNSLFAVAASLPAITILQGCGSDDGTAPANGNSNGTANCLDNGTTVNIGSNHGHTLLVSKEDVAAGTDKTYSIAGKSTHSHNVTISASNFQALQQNESITVSSNASAGHSHSVTVACA